jgi:predicted nucleotide-binding protein
MAKFKTYYDDNDEEVEFTVFIIHGHSPEWKKVNGYINEVLNFKTLVLKESFSGKVVFDKFRDTVWEKIDCAVAILTPDDQLNDGNFRARQNIIYELGYCQGVFDSNYEDDEYDSDFERVIMIKHNAINLHEISDLLGVESLEFSSNVDSTFSQLGKTLKGIYKELRN